MSQPPSCSTPPLPLTSLHWWWPCLKGHRISRHSSEVMVVEPSDCGLVVLQTNGLAVLLRSVLALFWMGIVVPAHIAVRVYQRTLIQEDQGDLPRTNAKYITLSQRSSLPLQAFFDLRYRNLVATDSRRWISVLLLIPAETVSKLAARRHVDSDTSSANRPEHPVQQCHLSHTNCGCRSSLSARPPRARDHCSTS